MAPKPPIPRIQGKTANPGGRLQPRRRCSPLLLAAAAMLLLPALTHAQTDATSSDPLEGDARDAVSLAIGEGAVGLRGRVRPGTWMPVRLQLTNNSPANLEVICQLSLSDIDGDLVRVRRRAALGAQTDTPRFVDLYAQPPVNISPRDVQWRVKVFEAVDGQPRRLLATTRIFPPRPVNVHQRVVGVTAAATLGLEQYTSLNTQHEALHIVDDLTLSQLPDRWYGLDILEALIWTPRGGDPGGDRNVPHQAIREWVQRGGHLVIILDGAGQAWRLWKQSPLADLLPRIQEPDLTQPPRIVPLPPWVGGLPAQPVSVAVQPLRPTVDSDAVVIHAVDPATPVVVTHGVGVGRVTVIGVDLSSEAVLTAGAPHGQALWRSIFGWQAPTIRDAEYKRLFQAGQVNDPRQRDPITLGARFIPGRTAMQGAAGAALGLAVLLFGLYWLVAGPISYALLRSGRRKRWSWVVFVGVVCIFSVIAWTGALLLRPHTTRMAHFSVVTIDAADGWVHSHTWTSLFVPRHGRAEVAVDPAREEDNHNTLASAGIDRSARTSQFLDPQQYDVDALSPARIDVPVRSTAKQLEADYLGRIDDAGANLQDWAALDGSVQLIDGRLAGQLVHHLPAALTDVIVIFSPGGDVYQPDAASPTIWTLYSLPPWEPGVPLDLAQVLRQANPEPLIQGPILAASPQPADRRWRGFLGQLLRRLPQRRLTQVETGQLRVRSSIISAIEGLTFHSMLPPPDFRETSLMTGAVSYQRAPGRKLDLTHLLALRRIIIIGHIHQNALMPMPLVVDGQPVERIDESSWTTVRFVLPYTERTTAATAVSAHQSAPQPEPEADAVLSPTSTLNDSEDAAAVDPWRISRWR